MARIVVNTNLASNQPRNGVLDLPGYNVGKVTSKLTKRLTGKEIDERRQKGLCFWCEDKFVPRHRCNKRRFYSLLIKYDGNEDLEVVEEWEIGEKLLMENSPQLFVQALTSIGNF